MSQKPVVPMHRYADGQVIEYTSFEIGRYSIGQVVHYAAPAELEDPADPLVYIRTRSGGQPFPVRQSQLRGPRYVAHFTPEAWVNGHAIAGDPDATQEWDCTAYANHNRGYLARLEACNERLDGPEGALDNDDVFKADPAAPATVRDWLGPCTIRIFRELPAGQAVPATPITSAEPSGNGMGDMLSPARHVEADETPTGDRGSGRTGGNLNDRRSVHAAGHRVPDQDCR